MPSTFVGRAEELRVLEELFARSGDGSVAAIIMGDPGSGKTRLLAEAVDRFAPDETARIVGYEPEQSVPLAACAELLQMLSAAPAGRGLRLLFGQGTSALAPMRVFEAAHRALDAFERSLVAVDDLRWVDELSLALCHYLVRAGQADEGIGAGARQHDGARARVRGGRLPALSATAARIRGSPVSPSSRRLGSEVRGAFGVGFVDTLGDLAVLRSGP